MRNSPDGNAGGAAAAQALLGLVDSAAGTHEGASGFGGIAFSSLSPLEQELQRALSDEAQAALEGPQPVAPLFAKG